MDIFDEHYLPEDEEAWTNVVKDVADVNAQVDISTSNSSNLDFSMNFDHMFDFNSSNDVPPVQRQVSRYRYFLFSRIQDRFSSSDYRDYAANSVHHAEQGIEPNKSDLRSAVQWLKEE